MIGTLHASLPDQDSALTSRPGAAVQRPPVALLREWVAPLPASVRLAFACSFTAATLEAYWQTLQRGCAPILPLPARAAEVASAVLDAIPRTWAAWFGASAAGQDAVTAGYQIGVIYTALLPEEHRATHGIYYTPPTLTARLLTLAAASGADWRTARVLDPACGGGAFLTPVALQIVAAVTPCAPETVVAHLAEHLHGWELDPFGAWMSQVLVEAPPTAIDLVTDRKGVFADVLQETLLATYQRGGDRRPIPVHILSTADETTIAAEPAGTFTLPTPAKVPWIVPRSAGQVPLVARMRALPDRLRDYGYQVATGPLVWNRHKRQLRAEYAPGAYPLIWAESVTPDGRFCFRAQQKNHVPFVLPPADAEWLITTEPCVLVRRTTAKEQARRLIAAELSADFIQVHGAVIVENHLNIIQPILAAPVVSPRVMAVLLNSRTVDTAFRCINGSVAVSASEVKALPLPTPTELRHLRELLEQDASAAVVEQTISQMYLGA